MGGVRAAPVGVTHLPSPRIAPAAGRRRLHVSGVAALMGVLGLASVGLDAQPTATRAEVVRRYTAPEARQGVAVDASHFYAITNREIAKYDRETGARVAHWRDADGGPFIHLNSGRVIDGRLYCAHSNYPGVPMESSIEVFDATSLRHEASVPLGHAHGSATWIERVDDAWWVAFAHYAGRGGEPGKGSAYTTIVRYDDGWRETGAYTFPSAVVERWDGMSTSGGVWRARDGMLIATGHHAPELHLLRRPSAGTRLVLVGIVPMESEGQGLALDPVDDRLVWTIQRRTGEVLVSRLH